MSSGSTNSSVQSAGPFEYPTAAQGNAGDVRLYRCLRQGANSLVTGTWCLPAPTIATHRGSMRVVQQAAQAIAEEVEGEDCQQHAQAEEAMR